MRVYLYLRDDFLEVNHVYVGLFYHRHYEDVLLASSPGSALQGPSSAPGGTLAASCYKALPPSLLQTIAGLPAEAAGMLQDVTEQPVMSISLF